VPGAPPATGGRRALTAAQHLRWDVVVDMAGRAVRGTATLDCVAQADGVAALVLDSSHLAVDAVTDADGAPLRFDVAERHAAFGSAVRITLPRPLGAREAVAVRVAYATTEGCTAIQWLTPAQTVGKAHPYMYTQCQVRARPPAPAPRARSPAADGAPAGGPCARCAAPRACR
jgi:leukotriene-A4 hydrolase